MKRNMKKLLVIALALMPSLSISTFAQDGGGGTIPPGGDAPIVILSSGTRPRLIPDEPIPIPIKPMPDPIPNPAPRSSGYDLPYCYHQSGVVYIDADVTITAITATVTRYADNQVWSNTTNSNSLSITVSYSPGEYYLELTLSDGQYYQGKYIIE